MGYPRQTHIGSKGAKSLIITDLELPYNPPTAGHETTNPTACALSPAHANKTSILQLPEEILVSVVRFATDKALNCSPLDCEPIDKTCVKALSRVCHKLRRIAQPLLFRNVAFGWPPNSAVPPCLTVRKFHRTLKENPQLREHCRSIQLHIPDHRSSREPDSYLVARNFATWLTKIQQFSIHGGFETVQVGDRGQGNTRTWDLIHCFARRWVHVEHVSLSREGWGLYLPPIFKWLTFSRLKVLNIHGISKWKPGTVELEPEKRRTAPFTTLCLSDYEEGPEATRLLIQWPAALTHFEFGSFYNNPHVMDYPMFESWLLIHSETLRHIKIGYLSRRGSDRLFNATCFPNLEFLQLSRWQMPPSLTFKFRPEDVTVLGPKLRTFSWDFSVYDQHSESWLDFGENEVKWLRQLAEAAVASKAALQTIRIHFTPDFPWNTTEEMGYPWDRMDDLREQTMRPIGLELSYNEPSITKVKWLEYIKTGTRDVGNLGASTGTSESEQPEAVDNDSEAEEEVSEPEIWSAYQGQDIREYFVVRPRADG